MALVVVEIIFYDITLLYVTVVANKGSLKIGRIGEQSLTCEVVA